MYLFWFECRHITKLHKLDRTDVTRKAKNAELGRLDGICVFDSSAVSGNSTLFFSLYICVCVCVCVRARVCVCACVYDKATLHIKVTKTYELKCMKISVHKSNTSLLLFTEIVVVTVEHCLLPHNSLILANQWNALFKISTQATHYHPVKY